MWHAGLCLSSVAKCLHEYDVNLCSDEVSDTYPEVVPSLSGPPGGAKSVHVAHLPVARVQ